MTKFKLIQSTPGNPSCPDHAVQSIEDIYNSPIWTSQELGYDKIRFTCQVCGAVRIFKINSEKTLLNHDR